MTHPSTPPDAASPTAAAPALKEWAVIVQALLAGEQIVDLRKGGIREDGRHFDLTAPRFWLFPTFVHQEPELLKPAYRHWVDRTDPGEPGEHGPAITIAGWAEVVGVAKISDVEHLEALDSRSIWSADYAASRLRWKRRDPLWVLALRAHRLRAPVTVPAREEYGGCSSWVDLAGLPADPRELPAEPALSDVAFEARLDGVRQALPDGLAAPPS